MMRFKQSMERSKQTIVSENKSIQPTDNTSVTVKQIVVLEPQTTERGNQKGQLGNQKGRTVPQS